MATIWNPQKNIPLFQTNEFPALWKTIIDKPAPGMMVGTGWLTPDWINFRGHNEKEYQECVIYHWPREIVPPGITEKDRMADLVPLFKNIIEKTVVKLGIPEEAAQLVLGFLQQMFTSFTSGPVGNLPLFKLLNPDGSLTFIYAHWYEGTPQNFQWVVDVNWERFNRVRVLNQQIQQLEIVNDTSTEEVRSLNFPPQISVSTPMTKSIVFEGDDSFGLLNSSEVFQTLEGRIVRMLTTDGKGKTMLYHPASDNALVELKSQSLDLSKLPDFYEDNLIQVIGVLTECEINKEDEFAVRFCFEADKIFFLRNGKYIYNPPMLFEVSDKESLSFSAMAVCPTDVKGRILKEVGIIKDASEKLNKIEWQKYGTLAAGAASLLAITISAAVGILSTSTATGPALATFIIRSKVISLISMVGSLTTLDSWAQSELSRLKSSKDLIESLKLSHPECFSN